MSILGNGHVTMSNLRVNSPYNSSIRAVEPMSVTRRGRLSLRIYIGPQLGNDVLHSRLRLSTQ